MVLPGVARQRFEPVADQVGESFRRSIQVLDERLGQWFVAEQVAFGFDQCADPFADDQECLAGFEVHVVRGILGIETEPQGQRR